MPSLTNNRTDILISQIHFIFLNSCFLCIFLNCSTYIYQAASKSLSTLSILSLMCFVNNYRKFTSTELLHVLFSKKEFLNRTDNNTPLIIYSFSKASGVFLIINSFYQANLMFKTVDGVLQLTVQYHTVCNYNDRVKQSLIICIVYGC